MRRTIVLALLFLLPIEVLAGVLYQSVLAHDTRQETTRFLSVPSLVVHEASPDINALEADPGSQQISLDLGETSDIVGSLLTALSSFAAAPPFYISVTPSSVALAVPRPPAI